MCFPVVILSYFLVRSLLLSYSLSFCLFSIRFTYIYLVSPICLYVVSFFSFISFLFSLVLSFLPSSFLFILAPFTPCSLPSLPSCLPLVLPGRRWHSWWRNSRSTRKGRAVNASSAQAPSASVGGHSFLHFSFLPSVILPFLLSSFLPSLLPSFLLTSFLPTHFLPAFLCYPWRFLVSARSFVAAVFGSGVGLPFRARWERDRKKRKGKSKKTSQEEYRKKDNDKKIETDNEK